MGLKGKITSQGAPFANSLFAVQNIGVYLQRMTRPPVLFLGRFPMLSKQVSNKDKVLNYAPKCKEQAVEHQPKRKQYFCIYSVQMCFLH